MLYQKDRDNEHVERMDRKLAFFSKEGQFEVSTPEKQSSQGVLEVE
jgi:hypothetical protein